MPNSVVVRSIDVKRVVPNPYQPRHVFEGEALKELAQSIKNHGVLQPITVRCVGGAYELIAGERRLRATRMAELTEIPAIIVEADDEESAVLALIENIQRQDLSYMEEAKGYQKLAQDYHMTQEEIARLMGKTQSAVANKMRLLRLNSEVRSILSEYELTERHARALLRLPDEKMQIEAAAHIAKAGLNVRSTESYIDKLLAQRERLEEKRPRMRRFIRDIRLFTNTVNRAASYMKESGVPVQVAENKAENYYEMIIRVPYQSTND